MTLYSPGQIIPDATCQKCQGQVEAVAEHSPVTSGDTFSTQRHYIVTCRTCGHRFVYNTDTHTLTPAKR